MGARTLMPDHDAGTFSKWVLVRTATACMKNCLENMLVSSFGTVVLTLVMDERSPIMTNPEF